MKILIFAVLSLIFTWILSLFTIQVNTNIISTLYNVIGIVFSIGIGLIVTFSISGVENKTYIDSIRNNIKQIRSKFIMLFSICTLLLILSAYLTENNIFVCCITNTVNIFTLIFFIFSVGYFIMNFLSIQKLKDEIFDRLLKEKHKI